MKAELISQAYANAKERYAALGIDTEVVLNALQKIEISMHCWQTDDVVGFEPKAGALSGGIQTTGNYPGRARNIDEVRADLEKVVSLLPGKQRINLHEIYGDFGASFVDRDQVGIEHFKSWMDWADEQKVNLDFNSSSFSHPKSGNHSLSSTDEGIRQFWIEHTKRCRHIANEFGKHQGSPCYMNLWIHDGSKDATVNRMKYRELFADSLDQIFAVEEPMMRTGLESKVFGIGLESYTVGSNEFCMGYATKHQQYLTIDTGHYHPTEVAADKVSSALLFVPGLILHVTRPIRWDSDHVTLMDDATTELFQELVRCNALDRTAIGLDYFDASINRIGAYVIGTRAAQRSLLRALLEPLPQLRKYEDEGKFFQRLALLEECKSLPWQAVYDEFCVRNNVPVGEEYIADIEKYEADVLSKR